MAVGALGAVHPAGKPPSADLHLEGELPHLAGQLAAVADPEVLLQEVQLAAAAHHPLGAVLHLAGQLGDPEGLPEGVSGYLPHLAVQLGAVALADQEGHLQGDCAALLLHHLAAGQLAALAHPDHLLQEVCEVSGCSVLHLQGEGLG